MTTETPTALVVQKECFFCLHWFISFVVFFSLVAGAYHYGGIDSRNKLERYKEEQAKELAEKQAKALSVISEQQTKLVALQSKLNAKKAESKVKIDEIRSSDTNLPCLPDTGIVLWNSHNSIAR